MPEPPGPADQPPLVRGGSLHRAPNGRLCTIQTGPVSYPTPAVMQRLWSRVRQRRYPAAWDGVEPEGRLVIYWADPTRIVCGRCRRTLGRCAAYQAGREYGMVEHTAREYLPPASVGGGRPTGDPHTRRDRSRPWYRLDGTIADRAATTRIIFRCSQCRREYTRNMRRLGRDLFHDARDVYQLAEASL